MIRKAVLIALVILAVAVALFIFLNNKILCCAGPVVVFNPTPNAVISSPILISGQARGFWFFEASFPVKLLDGRGTLLAIGIAQADGDWMTEDLVPFNAKIEFTMPSSTKGVLVFKKDNPSGLPQNDAEIRVPVRFK
ncbi:MAG: Gmad2 immunoglobulin-like domain-containing protein [Candidatus Jorgensenbacteria bacterium]|nr:Gmad2 immunoglobulin-like domain-containing protein [Candidatus Jorgensenbacteria bacterium]